MIEKKDDCMGIIVHHPDIISLTYQQCLLGSSESISQTTTRKYGHSGSLQTVFMV